MRPCVSPWAYERIQRWNFFAVDSNRSFRQGSPAQESAALMRLVAPLRGQFVAHIDLHETTDTDESEYTTTTEVYPDSPHATPEECIAAQVAAVCAGLDFVCQMGL